MSTYKVTMEDGTDFLMSADLEQPSAPLFASYGLGWTSSPYQTADARHSAEKAAELLNDYFSRSAGTESSPVDTVECIGDDKYVLSQRESRTDHEDARDWYDSYGWHLSTEEAGDIELGAVDYDWLDDADDDHVARKLRASDPQISEDEALEIVGKAREVREAGESICGLLDTAVQAYEDGDFRGCLEALEDAGRQEREHGDDPAVSALRKQLLQPVGELVEEN